MVLSDPDFLQFQQGDKKIFEELFWFYKSEIYSYAHNLLRNIADAEDVTAFAFSQLWLVRDKIKEPSHIKPTLYKTARNECITIFRDRKRRRLIPFDEDMLREIQETDSIDDLNMDSLKFKMIMQLMEEEIEKLPPKQKEVARLFFLQRRSMKEVAQIMDIKYKTANGQWTTGKAKLLKALEKKGIRLFIALFLTAAAGFFLKIIILD